MDMAINHDRMANPDAHRAEAHRDRVVSANDKVVLCGILGLILFTPLAFGAVQPWAILFIESVAAALFLIWVFGQVRIGQLIILGNPLFWPIAGFGLLVFVQIGSHRSAYGYQSQSRLALYAAYGMVCFLIVQTLRRTRQVKIVAIALSTYGGIVASFARFGAGLYWEWQIVLATDAIVGGLDLWTLCKSQSLCRTDGDAISGCPGDCAFPLQPRAAKILCRNGRGSDGHDYFSFRFARRHDRFRLPVSRPGRRPAASRRSEEMDTCTRFVFATAHTSIGGNSRSHLPIAYWHNS